MSVLAKRWTFAKVAAWGAISLLGMLDSRQWRAQGDETPYSRMAPIEQYLMERNAEIALARSAAPEAISRSATVLVLGRQGYVTAVQGKNGFVCMVARGWVGGFDWPEFWSPKIRGAECLNPPAARTIVPLAKMRTTMVLAGRSQTEIINGLKEALKNGKVPKLEPGAMSYMMSNASYLTDEGDHNGSHLMFYLPISDTAIWGADLRGSPVGSGPYWFSSEKMSRAFKGFPPIHIFVVYVPNWSDGSRSSSSSSLVILRRPGFLRLVGLFTHPCVRPISAREAQRSILTFNRTVRTVHHSHQFMKIIHKGSEEARNELPALLEQAQGGRATIITRRGRPVAALVPLSQYQRGQSQQSLLTLEGAARGLWGKSSKATIKKLRDEWSR